MPTMQTLGQPMPPEAIAAAPQNLGSIEAQILQAKRQQQLAQALYGAGYVPNSGPLGALAQVMAARKGAKLDRQAGESIADALKREFEEKSRLVEQERVRAAEAEAAKYQRDRRDKREDQVFGFQLDEAKTPSELKLLRELLKDPTLMNADLQRRAALAAAVRPPPAPSALREKIDILGQLGADPTQIRDSVLDLPAPKPPRALPNAALDKLAKQADIGTNLADLSGGFKDDYAGNTITGGLENTLAQWGVPGADGDQSDWWQQYDRQKNEVRNALFGSALTPSEQAAFEKADINPRMAPERIRANLAMQDKIVRAGIARRAAAWKAQGFDPEAIEAATTTPSAPGAAPAAASAQPAASGAPAPGAVIDGYRFKGGNPADQANWERL